MPTDVVMPQMGESITEGTITKWLKKPGDTVQRDEPLFEISTDKVDAEIPSPVAGTLSEIKVEEGKTVGINTVVATIAESGAAAAPAAAPAKAETAAAPAAAAAAPAAAETPAPAAGPGIEVVMPQMGESITEGTITKWLKKVGDTVQRDEPIFEISTDKVDAEIPSPVAGTLTEIKVGEGKTVTINTVVAVIGGAAGNGRADNPVAIDEQVYETFILQFISRCLWYKEGRIDCTGKTNNGAGPAVDDTRRVDKLSFEADRAGPCADKPAGRL